MAIISMSTKQTVLNGVIPVAVVVFVGCLFGRAWLRRDYHSLEPIVARSYRIARTLKAWRDKNGEYPHSLADIGVEDAGFFIERGDSEDQYSLGYVFEESGMCIYWSPVTDRWTTDNRNPIETGWSEEDARILSDRFPEPPRDDGAHQ